MIDHVHHSPLKLNISVSSALQLRTRTMHNCTVLRPCKLLIGYSSPRCPCTRTSAQSRCPRHVKSTARQVPPRTKRKLSGGGPSCRFAQLKAFLTELYSVLYSTHPVSAGKFEPLVWEMRGDDAEREHRTGYPTEEAALCLLPPGAGRRHSCRFEASFIGLVSARKRLLRELDPAEATCISAGQTISSLVGRSGSSRSTRRYSIPTAVAVIDAECRAEGRQERRNRGSDVVSVPSGY